MIDYLCRRRWRRVPRVQSVAKPPACISARLARKYCIILATQTFSTGTAAAIVALMPIVMLTNTLLGKAEAHLARWWPTTPDTGSTQG